MEPSKIDQALFRAVEKGDIQAVQERLRKGADVNTRLGQLGKGYTRLFDPYWMNPAEMSAWTPLMAAVNRGFAEIVRILLESGADIEAAEPNGLTALCHAARAGQLEIARLLLQWGANTFARRFDGHTLLHLATSHGHNGMMELLLDHGMDVNITNDDGDTALHIAAEYGQKEVVHLLLQRGANIQAMNHAGETALWEPIFRTHPILNRPDYTHLDVITLLRESGIRPTFREAIALGDVRVGLEWISGGADLNAPVWRDMTPLALACSHGQAAFARMLIEDYLNVPDIASLYNAVQSGSLETVELLLTTREWSQKALFYALLRSLGCKDGRISDRVGLQIEDWKPMIAYAHEDHADIDALTIYLLRIGRVDKTDRALIQKAFGYALL
ncbi:MAG TPA: ankyrin repeat domain-containing protein, partial [Chthonomonadaceae bacterium]|nr:ankyrin repeat domain-containing protein [Chthonomonadaceae bacterium]